MTPGLFSNSSDKRLPLTEYQQKKEEVEHQLYDVKFALNQDIDTHYALVDKLHEIQDKISSIETDTKPDSKELQTLKANQVKISVALQQDKNFDQRVKTLQRRAIDLENSLKQIKALTQTTTSNNA